MPLPTRSNAQRSSGSGPWAGSSAGPLRDPNYFNDVFLGAFRRDVLSFYPGSRIESEPAEFQAGETAPAKRDSPKLALDFQLDEESAGSPDSVRLSLFGVWYRLSVASRLGLGPRDLDLIRAVGRVMELHHQVLFRWSRVSLLQLRRGMPEDHYIAAAVDPSAYSVASSSPSRIAEAILTLRTMALSTYENRRVTTGTLILGRGSRGATDQPGAIRATSPEALDFGVELTGLKTLHRLCDGRRTVFLVDEVGRLADLVDIRQWALHQSQSAGQPPYPANADEPGMKPVLAVPCPRSYTFHALATRTGGHVCLVLSPNQEIKVFAGGVQAFVFAHGRWRVIDPESKYALWERAVANPRLARVLFQSALDLAEERQGGLLVVVSDPGRAIGRLIAPHDVLEFNLQSDGQTIPSPPTSLSKRSLHYLARSAAVTQLDAAVLEALAGLDGALVTDTNGQLLAFGAILRHDLHSLVDCDFASPPALAEGARTTAGLVASRFGPVLKISEDGMVSCFLDGARVWDL